MGDSAMISRLQGARNKLLRRGSAVSGSSTNTTASVDTDESTSPSTPLTRPNSKRKPSFPSLIRRISRTATLQDLAESPSQHSSSSTLPPAKPKPAHVDTTNCPKVILQAPSPDHTTPPPSSSSPVKETLVPASSRPSIHRTHSSQANATRPPQISNPRPSNSAFASSDTVLTVKPAKMSVRRIWVRRAGASPTLVRINEGDYVDEVRDLIITKYANSLGRAFDAPDVTLRIVPRERSHPERVLAPEEEMCRTLDAYFPGGQMVEEALIIDVPAKRTPRPSPRIMSQAQHYFDEQRPVEEGGEYFPPMPAASSPGHSHSITSRGSNHSHMTQPQPHSIAVLNTGHLPALPSPGATSRNRRSQRPHMARQHTSSPTIVSNSSNKTAAVGLPARPNRARGNSGSDRAHSSGNPALPTPPLNGDYPTAQVAGSKPSSTPPVSQRARRRPRRPNGAPSPQELGGIERAMNPYNGILDNSVPPINVLIVEDNIINLKLLEQLARRLKVRWSTAMNGRDAVAKWRSGGFHLVLMDIQLPIMSGLDATKEIRRLERVNGIGVFARSESQSNGADTNGNESTAAEDETAPSKTATNGHVEGTDKLEDGGVFKSPVIIVALTASSLQSDRHEALAAGCNDFLTKPVDFVWFERKVMEWGCMQALIDFDGWRQWKQRAAEEEKRREEKEAGLTPAEREKKKAKEARRRALLDKMGQQSKS